MTRAILHVDMDAFFASVEQLDDPQLRGKPVLVGGGGRRGVVAAASYEARAFGCHSAQPMAEALRQCPGAAVVAPRGGRYQEISRLVFEILGRSTPTVEPLSIDEAFIDVTGSVRLLGLPVVIARGIKETIKNEIGLNASIGVAPNKFLAKLGSDVDKPDGLTVIDDAWIATELPRQPIGNMWGVGPVTESKLSKVGIRTFGDLQRMPLAQLQAALGSDGERLQALARGEDARRVHRENSVKSISHEQTFGRNVTTPDRIREVLRAQVDQVARRLRRRQLRGRTVTVKIRYGDFKTITRSATLPGPTDRTAELRAAVIGLFNRWAADSYEPVRLIGASVSHLTEDEAQLPLFGAGTCEMEDRLDSLTDSIQDRFGAAGIRRGASADDGVSEYRMPTPKDDV